MYGLLESRFDRANGAWEERFAHSNGFWRGLLDDVVARHIGRGVWERRFA